MNAQGSRWSEVVRAYEESLDLLEAARTEYADAVKKTMDELKVAAEKRRAGVSLPDGVTLGPFERSTDDGFAQEWLYATLSCGDIAWAVVHAWVAGSYEGPAATLRVGVEVKRPADVLPWERPWLDTQVQRVKTDLSPCNLETLSDSERCTDSWIWMANVDLGAAGSVGAAAELAARSAEAAGALAALLAEESAPVRRALDALRELRRKVEKKPIIKGQVLNPAKADLGRWWPGTLLFGITPPELEITVWLAVDPKERTLWYAHGYDEAKLPRLAERMAERLGVASVKRGGYPGGVLLDRAGLAAASQEAIVARGEEVLRVFVELSGKR
jgi:hypothetical protein